MLLVLSRGGSFLDQFCCDQLIFLYLAIRSWRTLVNVNMVYKVIALKICTFPETCGSRLELCCVLNGK